MATRIATLADDAFVHFTYQDRAVEIVRSGKLMVNPPHEGMGITGVQAVSVNHGQFVVGTQLSHLKNENGFADVVAIVFRTDTMPKYGYTEEVIWNTDVNLTNVKVVSVDAAIKYLGTGDILPEDDILMYESILVRLRGDYKL